METGGLTTSIDVDHELRERAAVALETESNGHQPGGPIFLLAPPRSLTSVACAMLGQHPQLYGLPELQLFAAETIDEWRNICSKASFPMDNGLVRAVAQLFYGGQTEDTVRLARGWLRRRTHFTTGMMLEQIAAKVHPRVLVEKSPSVVYNLDFLYRIREMFPEARFIHLLRHPRSHGESVLKAIREASSHGFVPQWLQNLASYGNHFRAHGMVGEQIVDPQRAWYRLNLNICEFLATIRDHQKIRVRGEDLLNQQDSTLRQIAEWAGISADADALERMKHPEESPYACYGPPSARYGNDGFFLDRPALRPDRAQAQSLDGPLTWRDDGAGFSPEVVRLAGQFGYE